MLDTTYREQQLKQFAKDQTSWEEASDLALRRAAAWIEAAQQARAAAKACQAAVSGTGYQDVAIDSQHIANKVWQRAERES